MTAALDHLVILAPDRDGGTAWLSSVLGVPLQSGGEHPRMGTHNTLLRLGNDRYLEVLAANPAAPRPDRPRWFGLDAEAGLRPAHLAAWVVRTDDIEAAVARSPIPLGRIETMSRGSLEWRITIPADGSLPLGGAAPLLIQWGTGHPATTMTDVGCSLVGLDVRHPEAAAIRRLLAAVGFAGPVTVEARHDGRASLVARFRTPDGTPVVSHDWPFPDTPLVLRPATPDDVPHLERWHRQPHAIFADPNDEWRWADEVARHLPWRELFIAEVGGRPVGFLQVIDPEVEESHYWGDVPSGLRAIDISIGEADDFGRGFGTAMMKRAIEHCFASPEVTAILVDPLAANVRARRFYERLGFRAVGPRRFGEDDCLVYRLDRVAGAS
jgi:aminoglycoside 6'-N-acetyltransferase